LSYLENQQKQNVLSTISTINHDERIHQFINLCKTGRKQNNPFPLFTPSMKIGDVDALHTMRFRGEWMMDDG